MIPKVGRGGSIRGLVAYLAGPGRDGEHVDPRVVAGDVMLDGRDLPGRVQEIADHLDEPRRGHDARVLVKGRDAHVWHTSLSLQRGEGPLSDAQWREIADGFVRRMGFDQDCRWAAVRHGLSKGRVDVPGNDHCHVVVQLVREDGTAANVWNDRRRAHEACAELERAHGLVGLEARELGIGSRGYLRAEREIAERAGRTETQRQYLERAVRGCMVTSGTPAEFAEQLARGGIRVDWRVKDGARVGYSVTGADGVHYAGGKLARDLSLPRLKEHWRTAVPGTADQAARLASGELAWASLQTEGQRPGPIARESREIGRYAQTRAGAGLVLTAGVAMALRDRIQTARRETELEREAHEREQQRRREPRIGPGLGIDF